MSARRSWVPIVARAAELVVVFQARFDRAPTLRRLHYELVSDELATALGYVNAQLDYQALSARTAEARRDGTFPDLSESGRSLDRDDGFADADDVRQYMRAVVRVDRMAGQEQSFAVVVEKEGSRQFLTDWFEDRSMLVTALGGYASQTLVGKIAAWQRADRRHMRLVYAGDHDASGEDIERDLRDRLAGEGWSGDVLRVALLPEHVEEYGLPRSPFEKADSRAASFQARHGGLWQTELDALDPDVLRRLYEAAIEPFWDTSAFQARLTVEADLLADLGLGTAA